MTHISTRQLHPLPLSLTLYLLMLARSLLRNRLKKETRGKKAEEHERDACTLKTLS